MANSSSNTVRQQQQPVSKPQQLKITDYLRPVFQEAALIREYCQFTSIQQRSFDSPDDPKALTGLYVIPSAESIYSWFGLVCISNDRCGGGSSSSPWHSGNFRFHIKFPENYPTSSPQIYMAPLSVPQGPVYMSTHPDINSVTGQFSIGKVGGSGSAAPRVYRVLKAFRKSFYQRPVVEHEEEWLGRCAAEAAETLRSVAEVDRYLAHRFRGDRNLILLGDDHHQQRGGIVNGVNGSGQRKRGRGGSTATRTRHLGLSFL